MARPRQRRRRKHRGTQAGTVRPRRGRTSRPRSRGEARGTAQQRRQQRWENPPTWRGALNRAALAAAIFFAILLLFKQSLPAAVSLAAFMLLVYIPLGYAMDGFLYRLRQRRKERERAARSAGGEQHDG